MIEQSKNKMRIIFYFIICTIILTDCKYNEDKSYYYIQYSDGNIIEKYIEKKVSNDNNIIIIETKYFNKEKAFIKSNFEQFKLEDNKLYKIFNKPNKSKEVYLVLTPDTCTTLTNNIPVKFENCYKGKINIEVNSKNEIAYLFIKSELGIDGVKSKVFLDDNFILIKQEYISGYHPYYRIERLIDKKSWQ